MFSFKFVFFVIVSDRYYQPLVLLRYLSKHVLFFDFFKDIVRYVCKELGIYQKTSGFFGLSCGNDWLIQTRKVETINLKQYSKLVLMLQFKVLSSNELKKFDSVAYLYYVKQVWIYQLVLAVSIFLVSIFWLQLIY